jgi:pyruvate,water dikinase
MLGEREMRLNLPVSVRSSAAHEDTRRKSYAGSYETSLNVVGENELLFAIRKCWASLWKKHLMLDYARQKIGETVNMAVVVQKMVCAEVAGVTFTADPISGDDSKLVINSSWGLGDQIVSGNVIADRFEVDKLTNEIVSVRLGAKSTESRCASRGGVLQTRVDSDRASSPSLDHHEILELSRICTEIARRFPYPVDIEWALENQTFYILQVRAVTTM